MTGGTRNDMPFFQRTWTSQGVYLVGYLALDSASHIRALLAAEITPFNPQTALTIVILYAMGPRALPVAALAHLIGSLLTEVPASIGLIVTTSIWVAFGNFLIAHTLRRLNLRLYPDTVSDAAKLAATVALGSLVTAVGYIGMFVLSGLVAQEEAAGGIARHWLADLNGVLILAPLLASLRSLPGLKRELVAGPKEVAAQAITLVALLSIVLALPAADQYRFLYLLFVPLIWIALRWSWRGALLACLVVQIALLVAAKIEIRMPLFVDLQFLMLTLILTGLLLGAVVAERALVLRRVAMREVEQRTLLAMAPDAVLTTTSDGVITMVNRAAERMFLDPQSELNGSSISTLFPEFRLSEDAGTTMLQGQRGGEAFPAEVAWARLNPPANDGFLVTVRDATERQLAEAQLRERDVALSRAMRFAMAGELASALTHELNQPITALVSYLNASEILASQSANVDERLQTTLGKAAREAMRGSTVLQRLRNFYQTGELRRDLISLPALLGAVTTAFHDRLRRNGTTIELICDPALPEIRGDHMQIEIVLHNLIANAIDALEAPASGTKRVEINAVRDDPYVLIHVEDSGPGVAESQQAQLFEPFTTTKADGMGLGLAISRTLARARGGDLSYAHSRRLGGACFTMRLPLLDPADPRFI